VNDADDPFTLHLVARDEGSDPDPSGATRLPPLPDALCAEFRAAVACLDLLDALRPHWPGAGPGDETAPADLPCLEFGRFRLREVIGRGGFGIVYLAFDPLLNRDVALKLPRPDCLMTPELRRRFLREGQAAAGLEHVNIVTVHEAGEVNGVCYLASTYCPGPTLAAWLRGQSGPVPVATAARLVAELADGVEHAHRRGVLHRDLKPANVLLQAQGLQPLGLAVPKITDFGLAKLRDTQSEDTRSGLLLGTPEYMAPEQARRDVRDVGPAADVHALGVILYELLLKQRPFAAATDPEVLRRIAQDEPAPPRRRRRDVPRDLQSVCLKCLEKDPARRYAAAGELAADLRRFLRGEPVLARPPSVLRGCARWARRRPAAAALAAVCLLGLLGLLGLGAWHYREIETKNLALQNALDDAEAQRARLRRATYGSHTRLISALWQDGQTGQMADLLNDLRPRDGEEDLREFAWHYLRRQAQGEVWLKGIRRDTRAAAFSHDRRILATAHADRAVVVWDLVNARSRLTLQEPGLETTSVAVSPDGRWVAAGGDAAAQPGSRAVVVWDAQTGEPRGRLAPGEHAARGMAFAPDGHWLALCRGDVTDEQPGGVLLWGPATDERRALAPQLGRAGAVAFLPDGKTLAAAGPAEQPGQAVVLLIDVATGGETGRLAGFPGPVVNLAPSPDGRLLATGTGGGLVQVWDLKSGRETARFQEGSGWVHSLAFLRDGVLATKTDSLEGPQVFRLRDLATGDVRADPYPAPGNSFGFVADPAGTRLAFLTPDEIVRVWQPHPPPPCRALPAHKKEAWAVAFAPDGRTLASASDDHSVKLWDTATWTERARLTGHYNLVTCLAYGPSGVLASGSFNKKVGLWDGADGTSLGFWEGHTAKIYGIAFSPDGALVASGGHDESVLVREAATGRVVRRFPRPGHEVRALAFSPDGSSLAAAGGHGLLEVWDTGTWDTRRSMTDAGSFTAVAFLPDNRTLVTGGEDGRVRFWDLQGGATAPERKVLGGHYNGALAVAVSPDGRTLATGGMDRAVRLWQVATGQELICFKNLATRVNSVAFSPDGQTLAAALHDGTVLLWQGGAEPAAP
jgi:WD40 repeat protein/serine/threonine protein kinase